MLLLLLSCKAPPFCAAEADAAAAAAAAMARLAKSIEARCAKDEAKGDPAATAVLAADIAEEDEEEVGVVAAIGLGAALLGPDPTIWLNGNNGCCCWL